MKNSQFSSPDDVVSVAEDKSIKTIRFNNELYPKYTATGNATKYITPFALEVCKGKGYDIGCGDWCLPNAIPIDLKLPDGYHANNLPEDKVDYIYSSHCLEHLNDWVSVLDYWSSKLVVGGVMFLYLPHFSQEYWRSTNNRKHISNLRVEDLIDYFVSRQYINVFFSERDLYYSFAIYAQKSNSTDHKTVLNVTQNK